MEQRNIDSLAILLLGGKIRELALEGAKAALTTVNLTDILTEVAPELGRKLSDQVLESGELMLKVQYISLMDPQEARWEMENSGDEMKMRFYDDTPSELRL